MKLDIYQSYQQIFITFENKEEIDIFCRFFYGNDYFLRKYYKSLDLYRDYINVAIKNGKGRIYTDNVYHYRLTKELYENLDNYRRKNKLKRLENL